MVGLENDFADLCRPLGIAYISLPELGHDEPVPTKILAIVFLNDKELYAVTTILDGAPWHGLIHENSDALISLERETDPPP
jgi:hypothetical protein